MRRIGLWLPCCLFLVSVLSLGPAYASSTLQSKCENLLVQQVPPKGTFAYYVHQANAKRGDPTAKHPRFADLNEELNLAHSWTGELAPHIIQQLLPPGIRLVNHQLPKADAGIVKIHQPRGEFLSLRVAMDFEGEEVAFNIVTTASHLFDNAVNLMQGKPLYLFSYPNTRAVIDWGHGGGTSTTGGHTVDTLMNFMAKVGVGSVAMDQPAHGQGIRNHFKVFKTEQDYFRFRAAFVSKYVDPRIPKILVGHSKGGLVADMAHVRSGSNGIPELRDAYQAMVALSFVPDLRPGGSFAEKSAAERIKDVEQHLEAWLKEVNEGDLNLFEGLAKAGKCSALSMAFCQWLTYFNDYLMALTGPQDFRPMLAIMGAHDALSVTQEALIEKYVGERPNTNLVYFTSRVDFRGRIHPVGHLIFDHLTPVEHSPEADALITEFMTAKGHTGDFAKLKGEFIELTQGHSNQPWLFRYHRNAYPSALVLVAYRRNPEFQNFVNARIQVQMKARSGVFADLKKPLNENTYFQQFGDEKGGMETYSLIRDFISNLLVSRGEAPLTEIVKNPVRGEIDFSQLTLEQAMSTLKDKLVPTLKKYANILAFRAFVDEFTWTEQLPTDEYRVLNEVAAKVTSYLSEVTAIDKDKSKSPEQKIQLIKALKAPLDENGVQLDRVSAELLATRVYKLRSKIFIPGDTELGAFASQNIAERDSAQQEIKALNKTREQIEATRSKVDRELKAAYVELEKAIDGADSALYAEKAKHADQALKQLMENDYRYRDVLEAEMIRTLENKGSLSEMMGNPPEEVAHAALALMESSRAYQLAAAELIRHKEDLAGQGRLGAEVTAIYNRLYGEQGLANESAKLHKELESLSAQLYQLNQRLHQLNNGYVSKVLPQYFTIVERKAKDLLNSSHVFELVAGKTPEQITRADQEETFHRFKRFVSDLEKVNAAFEPLWGQRPDSSASELY